MVERAIVYETWEMLTRIDPKIAIHWVWGGKSERSGGPIVQQQTTYRRPLNCSNNFIPGVGHMVSCESCVKPTTGPPATD